MKISMRGIAGFIFGFLVAVSLVGLWVRLTGGAQFEGVTPEAADTAATGDGLIGGTSAGIAERLRQERSGVRINRGDLTFRVTNIAWEDPRHPTFLRAREMRGRLDTRAAATGDIVVRGVNVRDGEVWVEQDEQLNWNYRRALDRLLGEPDPDAPTRSFIVYDAAVQNVDVRVRRPDQSFDIIDVAAQVPRIDFTGPALAAPRVLVSRATGTLVAADSAYALAVDNAALEFETGQLNFVIARVTTGETRIMNFTGAWGENFPGYGLVGEGRVDNLRFRDVRFASPRLPEEGTAAFGFRIRPAGDVLTEIQLTDVRMQSQGSSITGSLTFEFAPETFRLQAIDARFDPLDLALVEQLLGDTLPYRGTVSGTARGTDGIITFDVGTRLIARVSNEALITRVTGSARVASDGFELRGLEVALRDVPLASLRGVIPGLPLKGNITGTITLSGPPGRSPLTLNVRTELAGGVAVLDGRVDLTGSVARYDLEGRLIGLNLQQLLEPAAPPVLMTTRFTLRGAGIDPNTLEAELTLGGRFNGWRSGPGDTIVARARVRGGTLFVDTAAVRLATMNASADGAWRFSQPASGRLEYAIAFDPITPFGPYIPAIGSEDASGSLKLAGNVRGTLDHMLVGGDARADDLVVGRWSVAELHANYSLVMGGPLPEILVELSARDLRTPTAGAYDNARGTVRLQSPVFALDIRADRANGVGGLEVVADGRIPAEGAREVVMQRMRIDLGEDNWSLTRPATFSWAGPNTDLNVSGFELRRSDEAGLVRLDGRVLPLANADFRVETAELPVGDVQALFGRRPLVSGALTTNTVVRATDGLPQLTTTFAVSNAVIDNVPFTELSGSASYGGQRLNANVVARVDTVGVIDLRAEVPLELRFGAEGTVRLLDAGAVSITANSTNVPLAPFAVMHPAISSLRGTLSSNVRVTGTIETPSLSGDIVVRDALIEVPALNQTYDSISALITFENRDALIREIVVRSGGLARAAGSIEFRRLNQPIFDITAYFNRFELVGVDNQDDAKATGQIRLAGGMSSSRLTGGVLLEDGHFPIPQTGASALDSELARFEAELPAPGEEAPATPFYDGLVIDDLRVTAGNNMWFSMEDARAELAGTLRVNKNGETIRVVGELDGTRGTYVLRAGPIIRRFDVVQANIRFLGDEEMNPAINITARRRVVDLNGRQIDIQVRIGGTLLTPTLALASESAAPIPQSELLSFLLFGQPSFALGGASVLPRTDVLTEAVVGGFSELISLELEQAVIDELGTNLDIFQIRLGGSRLNEFSPSLVVGEEIGPNIFLTVESGVSQLFGGTGTEGAIASFAVRLEWRISDRTTLQASYEPVDRFGFLRSFTVAQPTSLLRYQGTVELRRRWTW